MVAHKQITVVAPRAVIDDDRVVGRANLVTNIRGGAARRADFDIAAVFDGQRVARTAVTHEQVAIVHPLRAGPGHADGVIIAVGTNVASRVIHRAAVGKNQGIVGGVAANQHIPGVNPHRAGSGDDHRVIGTDVTGRGKHLAAIGDDQRVAVAAVLAHVQITAVAPDGTSIGNRDGVAILAHIVADVTIDVKHGAAVGNRQQVVRGVRAHVQIAAVAPDRTEPGDEHRVIAGTGGGTDIAIRTKHRAAISDGQRVTGRT